MPLLTLLSDVPIPIPLTPSHLCEPPTVGVDGTEQVVLVSGEQEGDPFVPLLRIIKKSLYFVGGTLRLDPLDKSPRDSKKGASEVPGASAVAAAPCSVLLRLVPGYPRRKRLYLIRHGESEWNRAQSGLDPLSMYAQVDHPLSVTGRKQAEGLQATLAAVYREGEYKSWVLPWTRDGMDDMPGAPASEPALSDDGEAEHLKELCSADLIVSSPLTRALQTCLLSLGRILRARGVPVYLMPNARERINPGSADSFGAAMGAEAVLDRLIEKTSEVFNGADQNEKLTLAKQAIGGIALDDLEARSRWWSAGPEGASGVAGVSQRLGDLFDQLRYSNAETIVLVGHSHLFRELLKLHLCDSKIDPGLAADLRKKKLSNCGVARLELDFDNADGGAIVGCQLLAGCELVK